MSHLLDTNAMIAFLRGDRQVVRQVRNVGPGLVSLSAIVLHELYFGAYKGSQTTSDLAVIADIRFGVLEFDADDAQRAGEIRAILKAGGTPIGPYDTLLAGQAQARDLTLVTRNPREVERVEGLRIENWEA